MCRALERLSAVLSTMTEKLRGTGFSHTKGCLLQTRGKIPSNPPALLRGKE
jgi:hypothetical protein